MKRLFCLRGIAPPACRWPLHESTNGPKQQVAGTTRQNRSSTRGSSVRHLTVHWRKGNDVPGVRRERKHVQLVVAHEAALAVPERQHEPLVKTADHIPGALRTESTGNNK